MCLGPMEPCTTPCMSKLTLLLQIMNINETTSRQTDEKFVVRFPDGMRGKIANAAKMSHRSIPAEIVHRIGSSFEMENEVARLNAIIDALLPTIKPEQAVGLLAFAKEA